MPNPITLADLETPVPLVDLDRLDANLDRAAAYARTHGLDLRPHVKTHKSPRVAAEQMARGAVGLTCATPSEAEVMSEVATDLLVAYPPVGVARARRLAALPERVRLTVALDSMRAIDDLHTAARAANRPVNVLVELDLGMHRVGVGDPADAIALAAAIDARPPLRWTGIAFYPGHIRGAGSAQDAEIATLNARLGAAREAFRSAGLVPRVVSGGSTPTLWRTHEIEGVTEFRPGTYVYNDRTTAGIGACAWTDCALTVLATVVSTAVPGQAVIDAGSKALGREPLRGSDGEGYGALLDHPGVVVSRMSEEHGILDIGAGDWRPAVGEQVRVVPNHVCIVTHLHDLVYGTRGRVIEASWPVAARGRGMTPLEGLTARPART